MTSHQLDVLAAIAVAVCWLAIILTWFFAAIYYDSKAPEQRTSRTFVPALPVVIVAAVVARAVPTADWEPLTFRVTWIRLLGLVILLAATALALWARFSLGVMWSRAPAVKEDHQLRTDGPYRVTRNPIYTGLLGMLLGTLLLAGGGRWIVPFPVVVVLLEIKIHIEERLMTAEFPNDYPSYRQSVPKLVPGLRLLSARRANRLNDPDRHGGVAIRRRSDRAR